MWKFIQSCLRLKGSWLASELQSSSSLKRSRVLNDCELTELKDSLLFDERQLKGIKDSLTTKRAKITQRKTYTQKCYWENWNRSRAPPTTSNDKLQNILSKWIIHGIPEQAYSDTKSVDIKHRECAQSKQSQIESKTIQGAYQALTCWNLQDFPFFSRQPFNPTRAIFISMKSYM